MKCKNCGAELLDTDRFCINCGTLVDVKIENCPFCGEKLREGEKFCHRCGAEIPVPGETPKKVQPGTYPNALSTIEIGALTDAVIAAAQREIVNDEKKQESVRTEPSSEERDPLFETGPSYEEENFEQEPYEEEPYEEVPRIQVRAQERGPQGARQKNPRPQAAPGKAGRREPQRREPQRRNAAPAYRQETDPTENVLNIAIIAGGILIMVVLAAVLFIYARNEELIPRSGPNQEAEEQKTEKKREKDKKEEKAEEAEEADPEEEEAAGEGGMVRVTAGSLNIRDGASTSGTQVIGKAKKGEEYPYLEKQGEWYYIDAGGDVKGYVHRDYVEEVN